MRSTKRMLFVGVIASIALLAVPALASAAVWKKEGSNLTGFAELNMTGIEIFEVSAGNAMLCEVSAALTTEGGSEGLITSFETKACPEGFGSLASCTLSSAKAKGLPWSVKVNATNLTITNFHTKRTFTGCATTELDKTIGSVTVLLESPSSITEMEFLGAVGEYSIFDSMTLVEEDSKKYGIG